MVRDFFQIKFVNMKKYSYFCILNKINKKQPVYNLWKTVEKAANNCILIHTTPDNKNDLWITYNVLHTNPQKISTVLSTPLLYPYHK